MNKSRCLISKMNYSSAWLQLGSTLNALHCRVYQMRVRIYSRYTGSCARLWHVNFPPTFLIRCSSTRLEVTHSREIFSFSSHLPPRCHGSPSTSTRSFLLRQINITKRSNDKIYRIKFFQTFSTNINGMFRFLWTEKNKREECEWREVYG